MATVRLVTTVTIVESKEIHKVPAEFIDDSALLLSYLKEHHPDALDSRPDPTDDNISVDRTIEVHALFNALTKQPIDRSDNPDATEVSKTPAQARDALKELLETIYGKTFEEITEELMNDATPDDATPKH